MSKWCANDCGNLKDDGDSEFCASCREDFAKSTQKSRKKETSTANVAPMPSRLGLPLQRRVQPQKFCECVNEACMCYEGNCHCRD